MLLLALSSSDAHCEAKGGQSIPANARRLLAGTGPNPSCPNADFPNQCYNGDGSQYACCAGSCGPTIDNKATCLDGPTAASSPTNPPLNPTSNPVATFPTNSPATPAPTPAVTPSANPPATPAAPVATPLSGGAPNCPAGPFQNPCFTPNGDAYVCCTSAGCGPSNQTTNTATCANNKYLPIVPAIFVFGDSLVDSGNVEYTLGQTYPPTPPYGINPTNGPSVTGRFSNGPNFADYIAEYLGLPFAPPILQPGASFFRGANFAFGGSGAVASTGRKDGLPSLAAQVALFLQFQANATAYYASGGASSKTTPIFPSPASFPGSLYVILTGTNDIRAGLSNASQFPAIAQALVVNTAASIQTLYAAGARTFLVGNIGDIGCLPYVRKFLSPTGDCNAQINGAVAPVNAALASTLSQLQSALPGVTILQLDVFNILAAPLVVPGVTNIKEACCGSISPTNGLCLDPTYTVCSDPLAHYFFDGFHPTTQTYAAAANEVVNGNTFIAPSNLYQTLFVPKLGSK